MESRVSACGLIVKSIQHGSKESGLSVISKEYLEAASKMVRDMLRSVCWEQQQISRPGVGVRIAQHTFCA